MEIFIDSANVSNIREWLDTGIVDGITTNPSIMLKDGIHNIEDGAKQLTALVHPKPVSVEVTTNDLDEMIVQAKTFASWAPNIVVKIPQVNEEGVPCYRVMSKLENEGIKINATAALSFG